MSIWRSGRSLVLTEKRTDVPKSLLHRNEALSNLYEFALKLHLFGFQLLMSAK